MPKDKDMFFSWKHAVSQVDRELQSNSALCKQHIDERLIVCSFSCVITIRWWQHCHHVNGQLWLRMWCPAVDNDWAQNKTRARVLMHSQLNSIEEVSSIHYIDSAEF